mgnify:CR=1 FL=1
MKTIILASTSPRRKELLEKIGLKFKVVESKHKEYLDPKLEPHELSKKISFEKAKAVFKKYKNCIIISADTFVVCSGIILGKPKDEKDAKRMLSLLSDKTHLVITGFTIIDGSLDKAITECSETKVYVRKISPSEIDSYVKTKEPLGKAGGYAIQGIGSIFIQKVEGNYSNAVGLPIYALARMLKKLGVEVL